MRLGVIFPFNEGASDFMGMKLYMKICFKMTLENRH